MRRGALVVVVALGAASCATVPNAGSRATDWGAYAGLATQVEFDHGCPPQRIRLIRYDGSHAVDLDICGVVRRYKSFAGGGAGGGPLATPTLVDVTSLYPASALPPPLPPDTGAAPRPAGSTTPRGKALGERCEASSECDDGICFDGACRR